MDEQQPIRQLPVLRATKAAYLVIFYNPLLSLKLAAVPLVLMIAQTVFFLDFVAELQKFQETQDPAFFVEQGGEFSAFFGAGLAANLALIPMITAWHRLVLLGHGDPDARITYSIKSSEWAYLWKWILFGLLMVVISIPLWLVILGTSFTTGAFLAAGSAESAGFLIGALGGLLAVFTIIAVSLRFSLVFPAAAIGTSMKFGESWRKSKGNTWRLLAVLILTAFPFAIIPGVVNATIAAPLISSFINIPFWIFGICVGISFWSWTYRYLVQEQPIILPDE